LQYVVHSITTYAHVTHVKQAVYKGVRAWSRRTLERAGERVIDVQNDDDDDEE
jgi:exonuclease III